LPIKPNSKQLEDGKPRVQEETSNWFLTFGLELKVIFSGFATANPLDSRVAEARGILQARGLYCDTGFFIGHFSRRDEYGVGENLQILPRFKMPL